MPKRTDIHNILLIGSGPIIIGQACEFDYSGTQAVKTLKNLGYRVVLINSNPATIMTDPNFAHRTYIEPITEDIIAHIIKEEKIDAILPTMGGQTALNVAMSMYEKGMLDNVTFLGANPLAIKKGEDRQAFKEAMLKIGMDLPKSCYAYNEDEALNAAKEIGFPLIIRASYTLAGGGSGVAYNIDEFKILAKSGLDASPINEILIEESLLGWKEFEMEVIRDKFDNCIIVCSIENLDPMGVHTGDSITIAPALTLTDKEFQRMRDVSFKILREIGVDTGGSNVQFAINPQNGRMTVIEMNPRVSRSSALASKATGYPIAKVATMLAVGFSLDEITNDITGTPASFEPSIDYIVTKIPRFTFEKFPQADSTLTTSMKSIGEVMAIGGNFKESLQKALCSLENGLFGFNRICDDLETIKKEIRRPNANRLLYIAEGFRLGLDVDDIYELSKIDRWFLNEIYEIVNCENGVSAEILDSEKDLRFYKSQGFSDKMLCFLLKEEHNLSISESEIYKKRKAFHILPHYEEVDTCAAEFPSLTSYLYSTIHANPLNASSLHLSLKNANSLKSTDSNAKDSPKVLIIGGGPNRIGQGIEFDYCCVHASFALKDLGVKSIMYNCNPETVSTDYDTSDILYFEPITFEQVRAVVERENPNGVIVHFGGQTPLKLSHSLQKINANIIGTSVRAIDIAEDREKFASFARKLGLNQPENGIAYKKDEAFLVANKIGYPVLVRPSYVLGGRAMKIIHSDEELKMYMDEVLQVSEDSPVLIDKFLENAIELDVDAICDGKEVYIGGIMQHIEEAGIHSGDSASSLPPFSLSDEIIANIEILSEKIALKLNVIGLLNIQFAIYNDTIYIIEVNPRASRTVPFVSKATGIPLAKVATRVMWKNAESKNAKESKKLAQSKNPKESILQEALRFYDDYQRVNFHTKPLKAKTSKHISIKESVFPFNKLTGADVILGPEMKSTGEVMGIDNNFGVSFAKSQIASKNTLALSGSVLLSVTDNDKAKLPNIAKGFIKLGFSILATGGSFEYLQKHNIKATKVLKISEGRPNIHDLLTNGEISMLVNTSDNKSSKDDAKKIRTTAVRLNLPYFTTIAGANIALKAIKELHSNSPHNAKALQDYLQKAK